jgi:hypothetical protein
MAPSFANPVSSHECPARLLDPSFEFERPPAFVHLYNERWRMTGTDKNVIFPKDSVMDLLERDLPLKVRAHSSPLHDESLVVRKAIISAEIVPPIPLRRTAELSATFGKWSGIRIFGRFADWLWQFGRRIAFLLKNEIY